MRVNVTPAHEVRTSNLLLSLRPSICVFSLKIFFYLIFQLIQISMSLTLLQGSS